ncbi:6-bladed beta-propeller [Butyricimonas paravirosa]
MKKITFIIITFFCIVACSSNKEQDNLIIIPIDPTSNQSVNWEQLFDTASMQAIPLETTDQSLLAWVDKIIITDTLYSFSSNNSIYTFNQNGQFLFKIAHQGRGPGEYLVLDDFYIDENNHYYILDNNSFKIIEYSPKGEFLDEINTGIFGLAFTKISNDLWAIYIGSSKSPSSNYRLNYFSKKENTITRKFIEISDNELNWRHFKDNNNFIHLDQNNLFFMYSLDYTIYKLSEKELIPYYKLDCGKYQIPSKILQDQYNDVSYFVDMIKNNNYVARITPIYITDKEILLGFQYQDKYLHALNSGHTTTIINNYQNFLGIPKFSISTNDAIFPSGYQNGYFYYLVEPALIPDKFKNTFSHAHKLSLLDENSNPILLRVKLLNSNEK